MSKDTAITAVKDFISALHGTPNDSYSNKMNAMVQNNGENYVYKNILVALYYEVSYMQFTVDILWEQDAKQTDYKTLGLHGKYNTNFQSDMIFSNNTLSFMDGKNKITLYE